MLLSLQLILRRVLVQEALSVTRASFVLGALGLLELQLAFPGWMPIYWFFVCLVETSQFTKSLLHGNLSKRIPSITYVLEVVPLTIVFIIFVLKRLTHLIVVDLDLFDGGLIILRVRVFWDFCRLFHVCVIKFVIFLAGFVGINWFQTHPLTAYYLHCLPATASHSHRPPPPRFPDFLTRYPRHFGRNFRPWCPSGGPYLRHCYHNWKTVLDSGYDCLSGSRIRQSSCSYSATSASKTASAIITS